MEYRYHLRVVFLILLLAGCGPLPTGRSAAEAEVASFHGHFNREDFKGIVSAAHPDFFTKTTKSEVVEVLRTARKKLGKVTDSQVLRGQVTGGNGGTTAVIVQQTTFEEGSGTEVFTFHVEKGKARLVGYNLMSNALVTE